MEKDSTEHLGSSDCSSCTAERMRSALIRIMIWAEHDAISGEARQKAMKDIAKACHEALEG
jgi:hypothetical protein